MIRYTVRFFRALGIRASIVFGVAGGAALLFALIAESLLRGRTMSLDRTVVSWARSIDTPALDRLMIAVTKTGNPEALILVVAAMIAWAFSKKLPKTGFAMLIVPSVAGLLSWMMKLMFGRDRPKMFAQILSPASFSFPSGHALAAAATYGIAALLIARIYPRLRVPVTLFSVTWIFLVGFSRVYLGVHWPTDVLGGFAIGAILVSAGWFFSRTPLPAPAH